MRGKKELFALAAAAMGFATAVLALVLSLADSFERSFADSARELLGGDVSIRLSQRDFSEEEIEWLRANSAGFSQMRAARMLASGKNGARIARLKTADDSYPLFGKATVKGGGDVLAVIGGGAEDGIYPAVVSEGLLAQLSLALGDVFSVGGMTVSAAALIATEPDPDPTLILNDVLVLVHEKHFLAAGIVRPGLLISRYARVQLPPETGEEEWRARLEERFPDGGWRVRGINRALPRLQNIVEDAREFLALAALTAMLIAGVGIGGAMSAFLSSRLRAIAVVKMLGGSARLIRIIYLFMAVFVVGAGALAGVVFGQAALLFAAPKLSEHLPLTLTAIWSWGALGKAMLLAFLISAVFVLPPVMHYARANPLALFSGGARADDLPGLRAGERLLVAGVAAAAVVLVPLEGDDKIFVLGAAAAAGTLFLLSHLAAGLAGKFAKKAPPPFSWGLLAVSRNRRQAAASAMSLGIGLAALAAISNVEGNFNEVVEGALRDEIPAMFMIGVLPNQVEGLREMLSEADAEANMRAVPIVRGRITHLAGKPVSEYDPPQEFAWILRGDRGFTWSENDDFVGENSRIVEGEMWGGDDNGQLLASFDAEAAEAFGLEVGDAVQINILGKPATATVANLRLIQWERFDINFVVVLSRPPFANVPHGYFAAVRGISEQAARRAQREMGERFANVTPIVSGEVVDAAQKMLAKIAALLRAVTLLLLSGAIPVVIAALAESRHRRLRDSVAMRLVGTPASGVTLAALTELACTALVCVLPAVLFGMAGGWFVIGAIFDLPWNARAGEAAALIAQAVAFFLVLGGISVFRIVRSPPYPLLRND